MSRCKHHTGKDEAVNCDSGLSHLRRASVATDQPPPSIGWMVNGARTQQDRSQENERTRSGTDTMRRVDAGVARSRGRDSVDDGQPADVPRVAGNVAGQGASTRGRRGGDDRWVGLRPDSPRQTQLGPPASPPGDEAAASPRPSTVCTVKPPVAPKPLGLKLNRSSLHPGDAKKPSVQKMMNPIAVLTLPPPPPTTCSATTATVLAVSQETKTTGPATIPRTSSAPEFRAADKSEVDANVYHGRSVRHRRPGRAAATPEEPAIVAVQEDADDGELTFNRGAAARQQYGRGEECCLACLDMCTIC